MQQTLKKTSKMWRKPMAGNHILVTRNISACSHNVMFTDMGLRGDGI